MKYEKQSFDEERALYGSNDVEVVGCTIDGPADGESFLKESSNIICADSYLNLRYPFWHNKNLSITGCELTPSCRAALWYSENIRIDRSKLHGIKALRECKDIVITDTDIISPEFGWFNCNVRMSSTRAESEYFMMRTSDICFENVELKGKYSFQYVTEGLITDCRFDTKDAFWHSKNVTVKNSVIKGEYLAWYSENLTLENCEITGTQPFCYCKGLKLINCRMKDCDLAFEKSEVDATVLSSVDSIKNPRSGRIAVAGLGELIMNDPEARGEVVIAG